MSISCLQFKRIGKNDPLTNLNRSFGIENINYTCKQWKYISYCVLHIILITFEHILVQGT